MTTDAADRSMSLTHVRTHVWIRVCGAGPIRRARGRHGAHPRPVTGDNEAGAPRARLPHSSETDPRDPSPALQSP